ncbi:MAG: ABC transporter substrate-binding protein [Spirochaetaceae bacterium]|nr:ABC transporter substrate-binding protein [Spirochaetaceae bacterium]
MRSLGRISVFYAALLLAFAAFPSFAQSSGNDADATIAILKGPSGISAAWMVEDPPQIGGMTTKFLTAGGADLVTAKLISGEIDAGVLPVNVAAKLYNAKVPIVAVAVVGNGMVRFLTNDKTIKSIGDLRGKTIHIAGQKATPDYLFRYLAESAGLNADRDYSPVYNLAYPEIAAALAAGKLSCAVLPEPFATQACLLNKELVSPIDLDVLWQQKTGLAGYPMSLFVMSRNFLEKQRDAATIIADSYRKSIARTVIDPAATAALVEKLDLGMKAPIAKAAIPNSRYVYIPAQEAKGSITALLEVFLSFDPQSIGGKLPDSDFFADL